VTPQAKRELQTQVNTTQQRVQEFLEQRDRKVMLPVGEEPLEKSLRDSKNLSKDELLKSVE